MKKSIFFLIITVANFSLLLSQDWLTDFNLAKERASKENKPIVLVFQGSDWCASCMKLDREVWATEYFKEYSSQHYIMVRVDFPKRKKNALSEIQAKANADLAEFYNKNGIFPLVAILDSTGKLLGKTGYEKSLPKEYIETLNKFIE